MDHFHRAMEECRNSIDYYCMTVEQRTSFDRDDVKQEILIQMWKASRKYNPKISGIRTYFIGVIKKHVLILMRKNHTSKNQRISKLMSLYDFVNEEDSIEMISNIPDKTIDTIGRVDEIDMMDKIFGTLNGKARRIFKRMNIDKGITIKDLSREFNMSRAGVYRIIKEQIIPLVDKMRN